ncbi:MAG: thioredoxin [Sediminibacterium sp.]
MDLYLILFSGSQIAVNSPQERKQINKQLNNKYMALELTDANFQTNVLDSDKLTLVDFWAEWCGPCRAIGPVIEELAKEYSGKVNVGKVNVDHNPNLSVNYGITSIPAILFIKGGQIVDKQIGAVPKSVLDKKIQAHL